MDGALVQAIQQGSVGGQATPGNGTSSILALTEAQPGQRGPSHRCSINGG